MNNKILIKRAYENVSETDGTRILVDRLWPRGKSKDILQLTSWEKSIAPSTDLRKSFNHEVEKYDAFKLEYEKELEENEEAKAFIEKCQKWLKEGNLTLVYGAKDEEHNNAVLLRDWLERKM